MFLQKCSSAYRTISKCSLIYPASFRSFSASSVWSNAADQTLTSKNETFSYFRTSESNPTNHTLSHVGRIYTVPNEVVKELGTDADLYPKAFQERNKLLGEHSLLVRKPVLEIISYLKQLEWSKQMTPKFVLWGRPGCGKSVSMAHVVHYCHLQNHIILNFRKIQNWFHLHQEIASSQWKEGRIDHLMDSQDFLKEFLAANAKKIEHLKIHKTYKWSHREETETGSPLSDIVTMGLERPKFAADCLNVLMKELKLHCQEGTPNCKVLTFIDGVNVLFEPKSYVNKVWTGVRGPYSLAFIEASADPNELSVIYNLKKMLVSDYPNSAVIATVDRKDKLKYGTPHYLMYYWQALQAEMVPNLESDYPFDLLTQEGWELFDPFVPVEVPAFSPGELDVMIDYMVEKKYIRELAATEAGRQEIHFLTGRNPQNFFDFANYW